MSRSTDCRWPSIVNFDGSLRCVQEPKRKRYLLDCQSNLLGHLNTRLCVPLMPPDEAPLAGERLNPEFDVHGERVRMVTQFAAAIPVRELGAYADNLAGEHPAIMNAIDMLVSGY